MAGASLVALTLALGCNADSSDSTASPGPSGGKADDAAGVGGLAIDYWQSEVPVRSRTFEGSTHSRAGAAVFAQRAVVSPTAAQRLLQVGIETLDDGLHTSTAEISHFALAHRARPDDAWTPITAEVDGVAIPVFEQVAIDLGQGKVAFEALDAEGDEHKGTVELDLAEGAEFSLQAVPHAAYADDTRDDDHRIAYRFSIVCDDDEICREAKTERPLPDRIDLASPTLFNKSGAYHPGQEAMYLSSLGDGTIVRVTAGADGAKETVAFEGEPDTSTVGVALDADNDRLWTCAVDNSKEPLPGAIWVYDLSGSEEREVYDLSEAFPDGNCNEVTLADSNTLYATDRQNPNVYKIDRRVGRAEVFATDDLLDGELVGLNGITVTPKGDRLLLVNYNHQRLITIDINDPTDVRKVDLDRDGLTTFTSNGGLGGPAGMVWFDGALLAVFPSRLARITARDADWNEAWLQMLDLDHGGTEDAWMTGPIVVDDELYLTNGQTAAYLRDKEPNPFFVQRVDWSVLDR